jgi:hypothetical protein
MKNVKFILVVFILLCCCTGFSQAKKKANKQTTNFRYEIACEGVGVQGTYLVKVWSFSKKPAVAAEQSKKNAVHGIIFKGVPGSGQKCQSQRPIASNPTLEHEQADFFRKFFSDGGDYMKYVTVSGGSETLKVGKEYKVGVVVSISKDQLRKDLETAGIIKGLGSGF